MSLGYTPAVVHLDPEGGAAAGLWDRLLAAEPRPRPILVAADATARRTGWAPAAVMALADALAQRLPSVTVIDLDLADPQLHRAAGVTNDEGIADALLFGASIEHLALKGAGHRASVVPAGAFIPSQDEVMDSAGWARVVEEATAAGGGLLLYVPNDAALGRLGQHVDRSIVLRGDPDRTDGAPAPANRLLAVVAPPRETAAAAAPEGAPDVPVAPASEEEERRALVADLRARQSAGLAAAGAGVAGAAPPAESDATLKEPPTREKAPPPPPPRRSRRAVVWSLAVALLVAIAAGVWHYFGRDYLERRRAAEAQAAEPAPTPPVPLAAGEPLPYSVAIEAHPDLPTAAERVDALGSAEPDMGFFVAPILIDTDIFYRVMAGPVRDSVTAAAVMDTLIARGHKTGSSAYDIRSTPLTFLLGEFDTRDAAAARMDELRPLNIPSYIVELPYTGGPSRYRLYSGAYSGPAEADVMRQLLQTTGLADSLVLRTGRSSS